MTTPDKLAPKHIAVTLPPTSVLRQALAGASLVIPAGSRLYRAVRHRAAVIPAYVDQTHRFGPPPVLADPDGRFSTFWLYAAADLQTALWEAGFCDNDWTQPGTFYIPAEKARDGLIAILTLQEDLHVLNLDGTVLGKLGIYNRIHAEHAWCQWFGLRLRAVLESFPRTEAPVGIAYPSHKHKNHVALAIQSGDGLERFRRSVTVQVTPFAQMPEFAALRADGNYADPLPGHFSLD